jgi:hypothetical protein
MLHISASDSGPTISSHSKKLAVKIKVTKESLICMDSSEAGFEVITLVTMESAVSLILMICGLE